MEEKRIVIATNEDNKGLEPLIVGQFVIGHADEVHGAGGKEVPEFVPTRHELIQLAKYWAQVAIDCDYFYFLYQQSGSTEIRLRPFAWLRINRIADLLGEDEVKNAVDKAIAEFGEKQDRRAWDIFLNGDEEQRRALQEEIDLEMHKIACGHQSEDEGQPD